MVSFPDLAVNLIYTALCLVPGFITLQTALTISETDVELDQIDKTTWSLIGSGLSLSMLYFLYVVWSAITTGRIALVVPVDLQWTELVAVYPLLLGVATLIGYLIGRLIVYTALFDSGRERSTE
jgi:uncharacterized membrane protein